MKIKSQIIFRHTMRAWKYFFWFTKQVTWLATNDEGGKGNNKCVYNGSGKIPLLCAAGAFFALAIAMVVEHTFMLIAVSKPSSSLLAALDPDSDFANSLAWQAGFFFISTWYLYFLFNPNSNICSTIFLT